MIVVSDQGDSLPQRVRVRLAGLSTRIHPKAPRLTHIALWRIYRFDRWHTSVLAERAYARRLIRYLNDRPEEERNALCEIGCGLGDILLRARYRERLGLDRDLAALRAARLLARLRGQRGVRFAEFEFPTSSLSARYDVIVMVGWTHEVHPSIVKEGIDRHFVENLTPRGEIVTDTVADPSYTFNQRIDQLVVGLDCQVKVLGKFEHDRILYAIARATSDGATA